MVPRCYAPELRAGGGEVDLPREEAEHLTRVLRLGVGAPVRVFDGRGLEWEARIARAGRRAVSLEIGRPFDPAPEPRVRLSLVQAIVKGDKMDDVVRDAVMLGVSSIRPVVTARTDVPDSALAGGGRVERWRRIAIASAKQCGRAVVPDLFAPERLESCLGRKFDGQRLMMVEPGAAPDVTTGDLLRGTTRAEAAQVLVGPEGGWAPAEIALAREIGWRLVTLGRRTFRADAAGLIVVAVLQSMWGDL